MVLGINIYIIVWFYSQAMVRKYSFALTFWVYYLCDFFNTVIIADYFHNYDMKSLVYLGYNTLVVIFMFEGKETRKLVSAAQILTAQWFPEVQGFCILKLLGLDISVIKDYTMIKNVLVLVDIPSMFLVCYAILRFQKKIQFDLDRQKVMLIVKCYFCESLIMFVMIEMESYFMPLTAATILVSKFSIMFLIAYLAFLLKSMDVKHLTENKTRYLQQQSSLMQQYCNALNEKTTNLEGLREMYENRLKEVYAVVDQSRKKNEKYSVTDTGKERNAFYVVQAAVGAESRRTESDKKFHFDNVIASQVSNGILAQLAGNRELAALQKQGELTLEFDLSAIPSNTKLQALDLSALLYNMLENAYEAVERQLAESKVTKGQLRRKREVSGKEGTLNDMKKQMPQSYYIKASVAHEEDKLIITVKNSKSVYQSVTGYQDQWKTSKENKKIHGYGMGIIKSIAEKYHGEMTVNYGSDWFENRVTVNIGNV